MKCLKRFVKQKDCRQNPPGMVVDETNKPEITSYPLQTGDQRNIQESAASSFVVVKWG